MKKLFYLIPIVGGLWLAACGSAAVPATPADNAPKQAGQGVVTWCDHNARIWKDTSTGNLTSQAQACG